ncbi:MAG: tautomerase family protein [Negativicutes bacterium]|nr:tautomerase family protein [Negativicutes bacterium]
MPVITYEGTKLSRDQKRELVTAFTKAASSITGIPEQAFVILLKEYDIDNIGTGGILLSEKLK